MTKSSVTALYMAEVEVPEDVYRAYGHTAEYRNFALDVSRGLHSGANYYSAPQEWAESHSREAARTWVYAWEAKIAEWVRELEAHHD